MIEKESLSLETTASPFIRPEVIFASDGDEIFISVSILYDFKSLKAVAVFNRITFGSFLIKDGIFI